MKKEYWPSRGYLGIGIGLVVICNIATQFSCWCSFCVWLKKERDTVSSSKEVTDSVRLDPWRAGNCSVYFGRCALFATKIQFASMGIFSSFGPSVCRSMSCPFWVIYSCALRLHSDDRLCLNQVCWWVAPKTKRCQEQVKLAEREDVVWQAGKA
jgi:hypothetical protein